MAATSQGNPSPRKTPMAFAATTFPIEPSASGSLMAAIWWALWRTRLEVVLKFHLACKEVDLGGAEGEDRDRCHLSIIFLTQQTLYYHDLIWVLSYLSIISWSWSWLVRFPNCHECFSCKWVGEPDDTMTAILNDQKFCISPPPSSR